MKISMNAQCKADYGMARCPTAPHRATITRRAGTARPTGFNRRRLLTFLSICLLATIGQAQVVNVSKNFVKKSIVITSFAGGANVSDVLKNDLRLSGSFDIRPAGESAEYSVQGSADAAGVKCYLTQGAAKSSVLARAYPAASNPRTTAHMIADDIVQAVTGQRGIAQTKIAFIYSPKRGVKELAVMDYDGYNAHVLTHDGQISGHPRWSPDGRKILYTSYWKGFPDVLEVDLITNQRRVVANFSGVNSGADYSPDGQTIALTLSKDGNPELYTMNAGGGGLQRLTHTKGAESSPTWSPDGQSITYVSDDRGSPQIYTISRSGGEPTRLTRSPSYNTEPAWSRPPAGADVKPTLAVTSRVGGQFQVGVFEEGTGAVTPKAADGDCTDPTWAPDGHHLVFGKLRGYRSRLYLLDVRTNEQLELFAVDGESSEPAWGPRR